MSNPIQPQDGDIRDVNGRQRYFVNNHWVRYYPPHQKDDLHTTLKLIRSFEWRFQKAVETGMETTPDDERIDQQRHLLADAKACQLAAPDEQSPAFKQGKAEEQTFGGMLAVSLFRRMVRNMMRHIELRIAGNADPGVLKQLEGAIGADINESRQLSKHVRRSGGKEDRDKVLMEMFGEPMNVFFSSLPAQFELLPVFYINRYKKITECWQDIDSLTPAVQNLIASSPAFKNSGLSELVAGLAAAAKDRCELMRSDQPDFDMAAGRLRAYRNQIRDWDQEPDKSHAAALESRTEKNILRLVEDYQELVYDIAHVRAPRHTSTRELLQKIDKILAAGRTV
jgi:hypothetical protein